MPSWKKLISSGSNAHLNAVTASSDIIISQDSKKLMLGADNDLQIYHDGTSNYIDLATSDQDFRLRVNDGGSTTTSILIDASEIGRVKLPNDDQQLTIGAGQDLRFYHTNDTSNIVNFTGGLSIQNAGAGSTIIKNTSQDEDIFLQVNDGGSTINAIRIDASDNARVKLANDNQRLSIGAGSDLSMRHNGSNSFIENITGALFIDNLSHGSKMQFATEDSSGTKAYVLNITGDNHFVGIGETSPEAKLHVKNASAGTFTASNSQLLIENNTTVRLTMVTPTNNASKIEFGDIDDQDAGILEYNNSDNSMRFTTNTSEAMRIDSSGNVGIGTSTPTSELTVEGDISGSGTGSFERIVVGGGVFTSASLAAGGSGGGSSDITMDGSTANGLLTYGGTDNIDVESNLTFDGSHLRLPNNSSLIMGASDAFVINHNGSHNYIQNTKSDADVYFTVNDGGSTINALIIDSSEVANIVLPNDGQKLLLGASSDLQLYHDGSNNFLKNNTTDQDFSILVNDGGSTITALQIDASNVGRVILPNDNQKLTIGADYDLNLYNNGSTSYISNSNNFLTIDQNAAAGMQLRNLSSDQDIIFSVNDGGSQITALQIDASDAGSAIFSHDVKVNDNGKLKAGSGNDLILYHDGSHSYIDQTGTGNLYIRNTTDDKQIVIQTDDGSGGVTDYMKFKGDENLIRTFKSFRIQDSFELQMGTSADLRIKHDGTNSEIKNYTGAFYITQHLDDGDIILRSDDGSGGVTPYLTLDGGQKFVSIPSDSVEFTLGASGDIRLLHNGSNSQFKNYGGAFYIQQNAVAPFYIDQQADDSDLILRSDDGSGGVTPYITLDGSTGDLLLTPPTRTEIQGNLVVEGDLTAKNYIVSSSITYMTQSFSSGSTIFGDSTDDTHQFTGSLNANSSTGSFGELRLPPTGKLILDQSGTDASGTYIAESQSDVVDHYVGGTNMLRLEESGTDYVQVFDNTRLSIGTGKDLQLYHDGTNSFINNLTGDLTIKTTTSNEDMIFSVNDGGSQINAIYIDSSNNGMVKLQNDLQYLTFGSGDDGLIYSYQDDFWIQNQTQDQDIKFRVNDGGAHTDAIIIDASDNARVRLPNDNQRLSIGASNDIQITHDGTNSYIDNYTGHLTIKSNDADKDLILSSDDGSGGETAYLTLDGSQGFTTLQKTLRANDSVAITAGADGDMNMYHDATNSYLENWTGDLYIRNNHNDKDIILQSDDGSGGVTAYIELDGSTVKTDFKKPISVEDSGFFPDSSVLYFGTGNDLRIQHNGSHSFIQQYGTGDLYIDNTIDDKSIFFRTDDGSGGVTTYLQIRGDEGQMRANRQLRMQDNVQLQVGSDGDAQFFHNTADTYLANSTGNLILEQNTDDGDIILKSDDGSGGVTAYLTLDGSNTRIQNHKDTYFQDRALWAGGALNILHSTHGYISNTSGNLLIRQQSQDSDVFISVNDGGSTINAVQIDASEVGRFKLPNDGQKLAIGASEDLTLHHTSDNSFIANTTTGDLYIQNSVDDKDIIFRTDDGSGGVKTYFFLDGSAGNLNFQNNALVALGGIYGNGGNITLYNDTYNFKDASSNDLMKLTTTGLGIGTTSPSTDLHINTTDDGSVTFTRDGSHKYSIEHDTSQLYLYNRTLNKNQIMFSHSGPVIINNDGHSTIDFRVEGDTNTHLLFIDASADKVGINDSSPSYPLDVNGDINTTGSYRMDDSILINSSKQLINIVSSQGYDNNGGVITTDYSTPDTPGSTGWYTICKASAANARGGGIITIGITGGNMTPTTLTIDFFVDWSGNLVRCNTQGHSSQLTGIRLIETASTTELQIYVNTTVAQGLQVSFQRDKYNPNYSLLNPWATATPTVTGDTVSLNGVNFYSSNAGNNDLITSHNIKMAATRKLYLDGGTHTFIEEVASDQLRLVAGGTEILKGYAGGAIDIYGGSINRSIELGANRTGDAASFIDFIGDTTYTDYGFRVIRNGGANAITQLLHRGTGELQLTTQESGPIRFRTGGSDALMINTSQNVGLKATGKLFFDGVDGGGDTYIQQSAGDVLDFVVGGQQMLRMYEGGTDYVHVNDNTRLGVGNDPDLYMYHTSGASYVKNDTGMLSFQQSAQDQDIRFSVNDGGSTSNILTLNSQSSRVGINTTAPLDRFDVYDAGNLTVRFRTDSDLAQIRFQNNTQNWYEGINSAEQFFWYSSQVGATTGFINTNGNLYWNYNFLANNNNFGLVGRDTGGNTRVVAKINSSNQVQLGDNGHGGNHLHYPANYTQISTDHGYVQIGPQNSSHMHFITDRSNIYTTSYLNINNAETIRSYSQDFVATRAGSGTNKLVIESNGTRVHNTLKAEDGLYIKAQSNSGTGGTDGRQYLNVFSYKNTGAITGAFIIHTDIGRASNKMGKIHVHGHAYGQSEAIDFQVVFYMYSGQNGDDGVAGQPYATDIIDNGSDGRNKYIGVDADGNLAIAIDEHNGTSKYFYHFTADMYLGTGAHDPVTDWSGSVSTTNGFSWLHKEAVVPKLHLNETRYRVKTDSGFVEIGPQNVNYCHFKTDRNNFYFEKKLIVDQGIVGSYDEDLILRRADTNSDYISIQDDRIVSYVGGNEKLRVHDTYNYIPQKIYAGDGSESAPQYSFWNDSNTGIFLSGADDMAFTAGGTERFAANGNGLDLGGSSANKIVHNNTATRDKYRVWTSGLYAIGMDDAMTFGGLNGYAMTFQMNNESNRGFVWLDNSHSDAQGAASLTTDGKMVVATSIGVGAGESTTSAAATTLDVNGTSNFTGEIYIDNGGSDYAPGISFMGGSNTPGANTYENARLGYYDNSGTGLFRFTIGRGAGNYDWYIGGNRVGLLTTSYFQVPDNKQLAAGNDNDIFIKHDGNGHLQSGTGVLYINQAANNVMMLSTNNTERMRINGNGNIGIANTAPYEKLDVKSASSTSPAIVANGAATNGCVNMAHGYSGVNGDYVNTYGSQYSTNATVIGYGVKPSTNVADQFLCSADNSNFLRGALVIDDELRFWQGAATNGTLNNAMTMTERFRLTAAGVGHFDNDVVAYSSTVSDKRLKENITTIDNALDKVKALRGVEYDWTATSRKGTHDIGLVAQEVEEVLPELVTEHELCTGEFGGEGNEKTFKTVNYDKMVGVLVEAIKEQQEQINELKIKLEEKSNG